MNVTVENLAPCKRLVRFEVDAKAVEDAFTNVTKDFIKQARMPGFRPGKAPEAMVAKHFEKEIDEEVKKKLIGDTYRQGIKDQKLEVLGYPDIEEIQFTRGQALHFAATVEINPEFELPEYRGLPAKREPALVSDQDVSSAIDGLRGRVATFNKVERAVQEGDYVVVNYTGNCEGKPLTEVAPTARGLTEKKNFWVEVKPTSFIPGFAQQLIGAKAGDKRTVNIEFPADFDTVELAGKKAVYDVELVEVKEKVLPALNDEFARMYEAEGLDKLQTGVRQDLQNELNLRQKRSIRAQLVKALTDRVQFDLPESSLQTETRNVVYEMVSENQRRGLTKDVIEAHKEEIYKSATGFARERLKIGFLFARIADKEGIRADQQELSARISLMAQANHMPAQKFLRELEKRQGVAEVYQQIIHEKVLDLLHENARIEDVPAGAAPA
ncbi:MAG TPA: trigger factor [Verrucomicrobiae bacterium]|nr:trigger factor [Verrucomicrobiae bacterium]